MSLEVHIKCKVYGRTAVCALENMHFTAGASEFLAIVGPSGAGKSTLLNIIAGLDKDLDAEVLMDGRALHGANGPHSRISVMFQEARLMPWLTVLENVRLVLAKETEGVQIARRLLQEVELLEFENAFPGELSGGMQRRVALVRAFAVRPALLLMDEPFLSLDAPTATRLRRLLLDLWTTRGPTVIFVTHNLREALALADRVLFLSGRPGRVVLSQAVEMARPRDLEDQQIGQMQDRLLAEHPDLLSGLITADSNTKRVLAGSSQKYRYQN